MKKKKAVKEPKEPDTRIKNDARVQMLKEIAAEVNKAMGKDTTGIDAPTTLPDPTQQLPKLNDTSIDEEIGGDDSIIDLKKEEWGGEEEKDNTNNTNAFEAGGYPPPPTAETTDPHTYTPEVVDAPPVLSALPVEAKGGTAVKEARDALLSIRMGNARLREELKAKFIRDSFDTLGRLNAGITKEAIANSQLYYVAKAMEVTAQTIDKVVGTTPTLTVTQEQTAVFSDMDDEAIENNAKKKLKSISKKLTAKKG